MHLAQELPGKSDHVHFSMALVNRPTCRTINSMARSALAFVMAVTIVATAVGDTVIVEDNFDSYANQDAFQAMWRPDNGDGITDFLDPSEAGFIVPNTLGLPINPPNDNPPDLQGKGVASVGIAVNESTTPFSLTPNATQWIRFGGDIFNDGAGVNDSASGMRQAIGLRNDDVDREPGTFGCQCGVNFLEIGYYNTAADDPRTPEPDLVPNTQFQYRIALFSQLPAPNNVPLPNWLSFQLDPRLDEPEGEPPTGDYNENGTVDAADYVVWRNAGATATLPNDPSPGTVDQSDFETWKSNFGSSGAGDGLVDINDIGPGWHRFSALVKPASITVELDLYRDGMNNATGQPGIDASETWGAQMNTAFPGAFNSLRIGPPSGVSGNEHTVFDNVFLMTITPPAASGMGSGAIPEPNSVALMVCGVAALFAAVRRSRN
jgi:hypothetical protein